jgi:hypothetical protein
MAEFTLPSGRQVETHEPLFGEYLEIATVHQDDLTGLVYAKFALIVPGLSRDEVAALSGADGRALLLEVARIWEGKPAKVARRKTTTTKKGGK